MTDDNQGPMPNGDDQPPAGRTGGGYEGGNGGRYATSWASWINVAVGVWEFFAPWIWGYSRYTTPLVNDLILGALIFIFGIIAATTAYAWPSWFKVAFGVWLIISPFVLNYGYVPGAASNDVIVGIIVGLLALIAALGRTGTAYGGRHTTARHGV